MKKWRFFVAVAVLPLIVALSASAQCIQSADKRDIGIESASLTQEKDGSVYLDMKLYVAQDGEYSYGLEVRQERDDEVVGVLANDEPTTSLASGCGGCPQACSAACSLGVGNEGQCTENG